MRLNIGKAAQVDIEISRGVGQLREGGGFKAGGVVEIDADGVRRRPGQTDAGAEFVEIQFAGLIGVGEKLIVNREIHHVVTAPGGEAQGIRQLEAVAHIKAVGLGFFQLIENQILLDAGVVDVTLAVVFLEVQVKPRGELVGAAKPFPAPGVLRAAAEKEPIKGHHSVVRHKPDVAAYGQEGVKIPPQVVVAQSDLMPVAEGPAIHPADLLLRQLLAGVGAEISWLRLAPVRFHILGPDAAGVIGLRRIHQVEDYGQLGSLVELVAKLAVHQPVPDLGVFPVAVVAQIGTVDQVIQFAGLPAEGDLVFLLVILAHDHLALHKRRVAAVFRVQAYDAAGGAAIERGRGAAHNLDAA